MPIIAIFFILIMFVASCTTDEGDEAIFSFVGCPEEAVMVDVPPVDITATLLTFPSTAQASWDTPGVINLGEAELVGPIVTDANGDTIPDLESGSDFSIMSTPGAITVYTVTYSVPSSPADNCEFEVHFLTSEDTEAPTFTAAACPEGVFNPGFSSFTTFMPASPSDLAVMFSDLMVTLPTPPNATVPLLTALAGNVMDNFDGAVPLSAITVGLSSADTPVNVAPTTADVFGTNLELPIGEYTVTINAVDTAGNDTSIDADGNPAVLCTLTMSIVPNLTGVGFANCPTDPNRNFGPLMGASVEGAFAVPTATDSGNVVGPVVTGATGIPTMPSDLTFFNENTEDSTYTITYTVMEGSDVIGICPFTVTVDNTAPTFDDCPNMQDSANAGMLLPTDLSTQRGSAVADAFAAPTSTDTVTLSISSGDATDLTFLGTAEDNTYTLTYTATDAAGNTPATCVFTVTVDNTAPTFTECSNVEDSANAGVLLPTELSTQRGSTVAGAFTVPTAMDDGSPLTPTLSITLAGNEESTDVTYFDNTIASGDYTLTYTATDGFGNTAACTFTVTVDNTPPTFTNCPNLQDPANAGMFLPTELNTQRGSAVADAFTAPTATDDAISPTPTLSIVLTSDPDSELDTSVTYFDNTIANGDYTLIYTATDSVGNTAACTFTVTVDNTPPMFTNCMNMQDVNTGMLLPTEINTQRGSAVEGAFAVPTATDDGNSLTLTPTLSIVLTSDPDSELDTNVTYFDNTIASGDYTLIYTATDSAGNTAACTFTVTVDNTDPTFDNCPNINNVPTVVRPAPKSFAGFAVGLAIDSTTAFGGALSAMDNDGTTPTPNLEIALSTALDNVLGTNLIFLATAEDEDYTLTYTATDSVGNTATCIFTIMVDSTPPTFVGCPNVADPANPDKFLPTELSTQRGSAVADAFTAPTAMDDGNFLTPSLSIVLTSEPNSELDTNVTYFDNTIASGDYTLTYTARDAAENRVTCVFTVMVDNTPPMVIGSCPTSPAEVFTQATSDTLTWTAPTYTDATSVDVSAVTGNGNLETLPNGLAATDGTGTFMMGTTVILYTATDAVQNMNTECSITITVTQDTVAPTLICPTDVFLFNAQHTLSDITDAFATIDGFENTLTPSDAISGDMYSAGVTRGGDSAPSQLPTSDTIYMVTYKADDDAAGNIGPTCTITVTVDVTAPMVVHCPTRHVQIEGRNAAFLWRIADSTTIGFSVTDTPPGGNQVRVTFGTGSGNNRPTNHQQLSGQMNTNVRGISDLFVTVMISPSTDIAAMILNSSTPLSNGGNGNGLDDDAVVFNAPYTVSFIAEDAAGNKTTGTDCPSFTFTR